jgi:hypothetical protein
MKINPAVIKGVKAKAAERKSISHTLEREVFFYF